MQTFSIFVIRCDVQVGLAALTRVSTQPAVRPHIHSRPVIDQLHAREHALDT